MNNDFSFGHEWGDSPMIFTSDNVTSEIIGKSHRESHPFTISG